MRSLGVIQHTSADYLGLMEDHLEGRNIGFTYFRPFTESASCRPTRRSAIASSDGWRPVGRCRHADVPTLKEEIALTRTCPDDGQTILAFGLGAQILAIAADGAVEAAPLSFRADHARRAAIDALNGYLPETFPCVSYMRDRPVPPSYARTLATDTDGAPVLWQIGDKVLGFTFHPGFKLAIAEDLIMELRRIARGHRPGLSRARAMKRDIEDALVP